MGRIDHYQNVKFDGVFQNLSHMAVAFFSIYEYLLYSEYNPRR